MTWVLAGTALTMLASGPVLAQANGDPGAVLGGQISAQRAKQDETGSSVKGSKSGANAMPKGSSGGTGGAGKTGGSNALSGAGKMAPPH